MLSNSGEKSCVRKCVRLWGLAQFSMVHCRGIFAPIGERVCDGRTKSWGECSGSWQCGIPPFEKCARSGPRLASKERTRTWGTGRKADLNLKLKAAGKQETALIASLTKCGPAWCLVPQVRVRSLDANLGGGTLGLVRRRFLLPDLSLSIPIRSRRFRFLVKHSGESCSTSTLPVLSLVRASPDCDAGSVA